MPFGLDEWLCTPCDRAEAFPRFDGLAAVEPREMMGRWRGRSCPAGHPLDGLLEALGWYGKSFEPPDRAHPLLFGESPDALVALDPTFLPASLPRRWPALAHGAATRGAFTAAWSLFATTRPAAALRRVRWRGLESCAMVYRRKPITDHFRRIAADRVLGVMEARGEQPYFFLLTRD
jgi:hypothetical protein